MALPLPAGLTPSEVGFLCEMEMITVIPRQRLEELELLGGRTPSLQPPHRAVLPLWLALLLKRQGRANIMPPPWLHPTSLESILQRETEMSGNDFSPPAPLPRQGQGEQTTSPPFVLSATVDASPDHLPYHWLEMGEILLDAASDDLVDPETIRRLMRDLREVRMAKIRAGVALLDPIGPIALTGAGGMEVSESRNFMTGVVDGLRKLRASQEEARQREAGDNDNDERDDLDDDEDMET